MTNITQQRRRFATFFAPIMAIGGLATSVTTFAQGHPGRPMPDGERKPHHRQGSEEMQERMLERRTSHMLDAVEATPAQRSAIVAIAKAAWRDIKPMREQQRASREKGRELMFAATIDRSALEQMRVAQLKLHDAMSQRKLSGMLDAMQALTPEQRAKLASRKPGMGVGMRGMHPR